MPKGAIDKAAVLLRQSMHASKEAHNARARGDKAAQKRAERAKAAIKKQYKANQEGYRPSANTPKSVEDTE